MGAEASDFYKIKTIAKAKHDGSREMGQIGIIWRYLEHYDPNRLVREPMLRKVGN